MRYGHIQHETTLQKENQLSLVINSVIAHQWVHWYKFEDAASGGNWAEIQLTCVHLILVVLALKPRESRLESCPAFEKSGQACKRLQKCEREKRNKGNQSREEDKQTTTTTTKIPPGSQIVEWYVLRQGRRTQAVALPKINRGYIWTCVLGFWVW